MGATPLPLSVAPDQCTVASPSHEYQRPLPGVTDFGAVGAIVSTRMVSSAVWRSSPSSATTVTVWRPFAAELETSTLSVTLSLRVVTGSTLTPDGSLSNDTVTGAL